MSNKGKNFLFGILPPICVFVLQNLASLIVAEIMFVYHGATFSGGSYTDFYKQVTSALTGRTYTSVTLFIYSIIGLILFGWWFSKKRCQFECRSMTLNSDRYS